MRKRKQKCLMIYLPTVFPKIIGEPRKTSGFEARYPQSPKFCTFLFLTVSPADLLLSKSYICQEFLLRLQNIVCFLHRVPFCQHATGQISRCFQQNCGAAVMDCLRWGRRKRPVIQVGGVVTYHDRIQEGTGGPWSRTSVVLRCTGCLFIQVG